MLSAKEKYTKDKIKKYKRKKTYLKNSILKTLYKRYYTNENKGTKEHTNKRKIYI